MISACRTLLAVIPHNGMKSVVFRPTLSPHEVNNAPTTMAGTNIDRLMYIVHLNYFNNPVIQLDQCNSNLMLNSIGSYTVKLKCMLSIRVLIYTEK